VAGPVRVRDAGRVTGYNRRGGAVRARSAGGKRQQTAAERRAIIAAALADPLPLGAELVDYDAWLEARLQDEILSLGTALDGELQRLHPGVPGMRLKVHHETDSRKTERGYLDITAAGPCGQLWAELKRQATKARPTAEQTEWLDTLSLGGGAVFLWRPYDWRDGTIQREMYRIAGLEMPERRGAVPTFAGGLELPAERGRVTMFDDEGRRVAPCRCLIVDDRIPVHTCKTWGPPCT
jgi:hypothetical protein